MNADLEREGEQKSFSYLRLSAFICGSGFFALFAPLSQ